jgi:hypothetical protein
LAASNRLGRPPFIVGFSLGSSLSECDLPRFRSLLTSVNAFRSLNLLTLLLLPLSRFVDCTCRQAFGGVWRAMKQDEPLTLGLDLDFQLRETLLSKRLGFSLGGLPSFAGDCALLTGT